MNTAFAMWRKSLSQLIRMENREEWDALDILSKWFIATRSAVGTITILFRHHRRSACLEIFIRQWDWAVILANIPVGMNVVTINLGKHTDKMREDKVKGVRTLPVLIGETAARYTTMSAVVLSYIITLYLIFVTHFFTPVMLLIFIALKPAQIALQRISKPRPSEAPAGYPIWPRWFSTVCFVHNRVYSNYFVLGLIIDTALRFVFPTFWR